MYGDTEVVRRRAGQLRDQAGDVRLLADQLVARTDALGWTGRAAASLRERIQERATHLRRVADSHDTAADSLDHHALEAAGVRDHIAELERRATSLTADARTRLARGAGDDHDEVLAAFDPPPSGHLDWLTVDLPGL